MKCVPIIAGTARDKNGASPRRHAAGRKKLGRARSITVRAKGRPIRRPGLPGKPKGSHALSCRLGGGGRHPINRVAASSGALCWLGRLEFHAQWQTTGLMPDRVEIRGNSCRLSRPKGTCLDASRGSLRQRPIAGVNWPAAPPCMRWGGRPALVAAMADWCLAGRGRR